MGVAPQSIPTPIILAAIIAVALAALGIGALLWWVA